MAKVGRPIKYKNPKQLIDKWDAYLEESTIPNMAGFYSWLGFVSGSTIRDLRKREEFSAAFKKIDTDLEQFWLEAAAKGDINPTVFIFYAKNKLGYKDKVEQEQTVTSKIVITELPKEDDADNIDAVKL